MHGVLFPEKNILGFTDIQRDTINRSVVFFEEKVSEKLSCTLPPPPTHAHTHTHTHSLCLSFACEKVSRERREREGRREFREYREGRVGEIDEQRKKILREMERIRKID